MSFASSLRGAFLLLLLCASAARAGDPPPAAAPAAAAEAATPAQDDKPSKRHWFKDPEDGWPDLSGFLAAPHGFIPVPVPITEPAIGYGAAVAAVFIKQKEGGTRPDIYGVGAMRTSNGSKGAFAGHSGYYLDRRLQLLAAGVVASVNFDFHGLGGRDPELDGNPLRYNLDIKGGGLGTNWKIGGADSPWHFGLGYGYAQVSSSFVNNEARQRYLARPDAEPLSPKVNISGVRFALGYDSRDNIFTPTKGWFTELSLGASARAIGGSSNFQILDWVSIWHRPIVPEKLFFGLFSEVRQSFNDVPFFLRPAISLRGVPIQRYQGDGMACAEAELRWQFHRRWSLVGFAGAGVTWTGQSRFQRGQSLVSGGGGIRYLIARRFGLHVGLDAAFSQGDSAFYVQFGSAWARP